MPKLQYFGHQMQTDNSLVDAGKDQRQEEKKASEDEMAGRHRYNEHELGQTPGDSEGQGGLAASLGSQIAVHD